MGKYTDTSKRIIQIHGTIKKFLILLMLSVSFTMYAQTTLQVTTRKGITTVTSGVDSLSVFGITEPYEITQTSFKALACVVLTDNAMDDAIWAGVCYTSDNTEPSLENGSLVKQFSNGSRVHTVLLDNLTSATTYFYRIFFQYADGNIAYGKVYHAKTQTNGGDVPSENPYSKFINGHEFVDLGLPSGLYWATCNVGAESETDYGDYYAWGEINTKNEYTSSNYNGYTERNGEGLTEDEDVARQKWGENIRMPKVDELTELKENCTWTWQNNYKQSGTNGYLVTGSNGNSIFLPASGCYSSYSYLLGSICSYWSSSCDDNSSCAIDIDAYSGGNISIDHFSDRANGQPIRPVVEKQVIEHPTTSKFVNGYEFVDLGLP